MRKIYALLGGLLMATATVWTEPVTFLCVPDARVTPSTIDKVNPVGATTTATEDNLEVEVIAGATNRNQANGLPGATPIGSGTPSSSSLSVTLTASKNGTPDRGGAYTVTDSSVVYGANPLVIPSGFETLRAVSSGDGYQYPRGVALADGTILVVHEDHVGTQGIAISSRNDSTHAWTSTGNIWTIGTGGTAFTTNRHPSPDIWLEPGQDGVDVIRVASLVFADDIAGINQRVRIDTSYDNGATWSWHYTNLTFDCTTIVYNYLRVTYDELGQQLVLGLSQESGGTFTGIYYVSNDGGATFQRLTAADQSDVRVHDIRAWMGTIYLLTLDNSGNAELLQRTAASATWTSLGNANYVAAYSGAGSRATLVITPDGTLYVDWRRNANQGIMQRSVSTDGGQSWLYYNFFLDDSTAAFTTGLKGNCAVYSTQRIFLIGTMVSSGDTHDNSTVALLSGGVANYSQGGAGVYSGMIPSDLPATRSATWTFLGGSAESVNVTDTAGQQVLKVDNTNATGYWTVNHASSPMEVQSAHWIISPDSTGGSTLTTDVALRVHANETTGLNTYAAVELRINLTTRQVQAYDLNGLANIGAAVTYDTGTDGIEVYLIVSAKGTGANGLASAYVRRSTSEKWVTIASDNSVTMSAGTTNTIQFGKLNASTAEVLTRYFQPGHWGNTPGPTSSIPPTDGIPARTSPDRIPQGVHVRWNGSPVIAGDTWTLRARSLTPLSYTSPMSVAASPTRQWVGTVGTAGANYRIVYNMSTSYRAKLSNNMVFVGWANAPGVETVRLVARSGGAWVTQVTADTRVINMTSCGIARDNAASYEFYPNSANSSSNLAIWEANAFDGYWCVMTDGGGNTIAGTIARNDPGQFTTASNVVRAAFELVPSSVVAVAGTFAGFSLATTTGTLAIYAPDGLCIGTQANEAEVYYAVEVDLAPGYTTPAAGLIGFGAAYALARQERDGSSMRYITPDQLTMLSGRAMTGRRVGRKVQRIIELPYDRILLHASSYARVNATGQNSMAFVTQARAPIDNNLHAVVSAHKLAGQRYPVGLVISGDWGNDPGTAAQSFVDQDVVWGYLESEVDVTAGRGQLRGRTRGHELGGRLVITEAV